MWLPSSWESTPKGKILTSGANVVKVWYKRRTDQVYFRMSRICVCVCVVISVTDMIWYLKYSTLEEVNIYCPWDGYPSTKIYLNIVSGFITFRLSIHNHIPKGPLLLLLSGSISCYHVWDTLLPGWVSYSSRCGLSPTQHVHQRRHSIPPTLSGTLVHYTRSLR